MLKFVITSDCDFGFRGGSGCCGPSSSATVAEPAPVGKYPIGKSPIGKYPVGKYPVAPAPVVTKG